MAKRGSSKKKPAKSAKAKKDKLGKALDTLKGARHVQYFGQLSADGVPEIDAAELSKLKRKLKKKKIALGKVRFIALNAPFKRRSPISAA